MSLQDFERRKLIQQNAAKLAGDAIAEMRTAHLQELQRFVEGVSQVVDCLRHIEQLALTCQEDPKIVLAAVGISACGGLGIARELGLLDK